MGVEYGDILFIVVGIFLLLIGESDICYVEVVVKGIGVYMIKGYKVIVNKLIVFIGFGDWVWRIVLDGVEEYKKEEGGICIEIEVEFDVVSNLEFLCEGLVIFDIFNLDRIVLGSNS